MRVSVELDDLEPVADGAVDGAPGGSPVERRAAARTSPSSALRPRPERARCRWTCAARASRRRSRRLERYLEDASLAGLARVTVIHGLGTGALRDAVRSEAGAHPLVKTVRAGERGEGGDGVTVVELG